MAERLVVLNTKRERIRIPLKRETDCRSRFASRLPARSVLLLRRGVHRTPAPQWQGKRIAAVALLLRNDRAWKADCHTPYGGLACRSVGASALQRCPPDTRTAMTSGRIAAHLSVFAMTKLLDILNA